MKPKWFGKVKKGKVILKDKDKFDEYIFTLEDKDIELVVGKVKKYRSTPENKYYWGVVLELLSEFSGDSKEWWHEFIKAKFLTEIVHKEVGKKVIEGKMLRRTSALSTVEFEDLMRKVRIWASQELQIYVPEPNEVDAK